MPSSMRRDQLLDAAISTLARAGGRGLTHRAVDRAAGVAEGSTSYYFRTRAGLLHAVVHRLAELDASAVPVLAGTDGSNVRVFSDAFGSVVETLRSSGRDRLLARYELELEAARRPELRAPLAAGEAALRSLVTERFTALGVRAPDAAARDFLVLLDGVLFHEVTRAGGSVTAGPELRRLVRRLLTACGVPG